MKNQILFCLSALFFFPLSGQEVAFRVKKIWDNNQHAAFPSLVKYRGDYYCAFREAESHIFDSDGKAEGKVRIIKSSDGEEWQSVALVRKKDYDLRDPKLSVTPEGRLMISMGCSLYKGWNLAERSSTVSFSDDGVCFTEPVPVTIAGSAGNGRDWIWKVTWHEGVGYAVMYSMTAIRDATICLVSTRDGLRYERVASFNIEGFPNESTIRFSPDGKMYALVRRDGMNKKGCWGVSSPPFDRWDWKELDLQLGGPEFIFLDDGFLIAGSRSYYIPSRLKTVLFAGDRQGEFHEILVLPSNGDTGYPSFIVENDELWVSYYSSLSPKWASIYLAKIPLSSIRFIDHLSRNEIQHSRE